MENKTINYGADVFQLLHGYEDEEGTIHKDFEVKEITGVEEEQISKANVKNNGAKIIRTLLERCILRIGTITPSIGKDKWREVIQSLSVADQDYALLKIREESLGKDIEMKHTCPYCKAELHTIVGIDELEITPFKGDELIEFELPKGYRDREGKVHKFGKIRYPNGFDREILDPIARKNLGTANTMLLTRCIQELEGVKVHDKIIRELSIKDRDYLLDLMKENAYGVDLETEIICSSCGEEFETTLNMVNFL